MWRNISLRHRLNLMFAALLLLWLAADIGRILANAGPRVQAEALQRFATDSGVRGGFARRSSRRAEAR